MEQILFDFGSVAEGTLSSGLEIGQLPSLAEKYAERSGRALIEFETYLTDTLAPGVRQRGFLSRSEFLELCQWRSAQTRELASGNPSHIIEAQSAKALAGENEAQRMAPLVLLEGIAMPMASVVLHFVHPEPYPVLDTRGLWSVGIAPPLAYKLKFWQEYTDIARELARSSGLTMRQLDRALMQYAHEYMPRAG